MKILCIGDLNADLFIPYGEAKRKIQVLVSDNTEACKVSFRGGGSVANTARILGKLGNHPYFVTDLCNDSISEQLIKEMKEMNVDTSYSLLGNNKTIVCLAVCEEDGSRVIFPWLPPKADLPHFRKESFCKIPKEDYLVFTSGMILNNDLETMHAVYDFVADLKKNTNSVFAFDLNMRKETYGLSKERKHFYKLYTEMADIILGSIEDEFMPLTQKNTCEEAIHSFRENQIVIARDGQNPVHIVQGKKESKVECEKVKVLHTIGAGDTFNGVFLSYYLKNKPLEECVKKANYACGYMISHSAYLALPEELEKESK